MRVDVQPDFQPVVQGENPALIAELFEKHLWLWCFQDMRVIGRQTLEKIHDDLSRRTIRRSDP